MRQQSMSLKDGAETAVRDIRRKTRKQYSELPAEQRLTAFWRPTGLYESLTFARYSPHTSKYVLHLFSEI